jgi:cyanophycin synthetase
VYYGDCSGPDSAEVILRDPIVDFAVFECARGGILRAGLGFDKCDISIITNVSDDHLGLDDINTVEEMAKVKAVVARNTFDDGYAILNADDDLVYAIKEELDCNIALFSMDEKNERIKLHRQEGGLAAIIEKGYFSVCKGQWKTRIARVEDVPLTFQGKAESMIKNILPAILAATIRDFKPDLISAALKSFIPSPTVTPGRLNIFHFKNFDLMIDYAHNRDGYKELKKFIAHMDSYKIGIVTSPGDRRDEDIRNTGYYATQMFDEIIIRHDKDSRGRPKEQITQLIIEGIVRINPEAVVNVVSDELEAIQFAMNTARQGAFIVDCSDEVQEAIDFVMQAKEREDSMDNETELQWNASC